MGTATATSVDELTIAAFRLPEEAFDVVDVDVGTIFAIDDSLPI